MILSFIFHLPHTEYSVIHCQLITNPIECNIHTNNKTRITHRIQFPEYLQILRKQNCFADMIGNFQTNINCVHLFTHWIWKNRWRPRDRDFFALYISVFSLLNLVSRFKLKKKKNFKTILLFVQIRRSQRLFSVSLTLCCWCYLDSLYYFQRELLLLTVATYCICCCRRRRHSQYLLYFAYTHHERKTSSNVENSVLFSWLPKHYPMLLTQYTTYTHIDTPAYTYTYAYILDGQLTWQYNYKCAG